MKKMWILAVLIVLFPIASVASTGEKFTLTSSSPKVSRLDKVANKWEAEWQKMTTALGERLNVKWSKQSGFQLFDWESATVSVKSGKIVYVCPEKPQQEYFLDYHGGSNEVVMGYTIKF